MSRELSKGGGLQRPLVMPVDDVVGEFVQRDHLPHVLIDAAGKRIDLFPLLLGLVRVLVRLEMGAVGE